MMGRRAAAWRDARTRRYQAGTAGLYDSRASLAPESRRARADDSRPRAARRAARPRRCGGDAQCSNLMLLPPIQLDYAASPPLLDENRETQWHDPHRGRVRCCESPDGSIVEMVVVIVRLQHKVERRQLVEANPRGDPAAWTGESHRRRALAPHRIGQNVEPTQLHEEARVSHPRHGEL